jgi:hypothetical protein
MTSSGVFPNTEQAPANPPKSPTTSFGTCFFGSPSRYQSLQDSMTKKRIAWLLPCFKIVAVTPVERNISLSLEFHFHMSFIWALVSIYVLNCMSVKYKALTVSGGLKLEMPNSSKDDKSQKNRFRLSTTTTKNCDRCWQVVVIQRFLEFHFADNLCFELYVSKIFGADSWFEKSWRCLILQKPCHKHSQKIT